MMKTSVVPKGHIPKLLGTIDYSWMYDCELSTDVLLIPDDGEGIKAHKVILAAFSPFLKECLLEEAEYHCDKMLQLHLPDYSNAAIRDFVKVLYGCEEDDERAMACLEEVESLWIQDVPIKPLEEDGRTKAARGKRAAYRKRVRRTSSYDPDWKLEKHKKRQEAVALAASEIVDVKVEPSDDDDNSYTGDDYPVKGEPSGGEDYDEGGESNSKVKADENDDDEEDDEEEDDDDEDGEDLDEEESEDDAWNPFKSSKSKKPGRAPPVSSDQYTRQKYNLKPDTSGLYPCNVSGCDYKSKNNNTTRQHIYRFHHGRNRDWYQRTKAKRNRDGTPRGRGRPKRDEEVFDPPKPEPKEELLEDGNGKEKINYNKAYAQMSKWELCAHCGVSVLVTEMSKHCYNYHGVKLPYQCTDCDESFTSEVVLERHREKHIYKLCPYCKIVIRDSKKMESHLAGCNMKKLREIKPLKIKNRRRRRPGYEEIEFEPNKDDPNKCPKCDYRNAKLTRVRGHYVSRHIRQQCPHCDKKLLFASMERHILMNHRPDLLKFECKECDKKFFNERLLKFHNEENHIKELKYICDHCAMSFYSEFKLSHHVTIKHRTPQIHPCPFCDKTYRDRDSRRKHLRRYHPDKWRDKDKDEQATYISNKCFGATMNHEDKDNEDSNDKTMEVPHHHQPMGEMASATPDAASTPPIMSMNHSHMGMDHHHNHHAHDEDMRIAEAQMHMERLSEMQMEQQHLRLDGAHIEAARLNAYRLNEAFRLNDPSHMSEAAKMMEAARLNALRMGDHHLNKMDME